MITGFGGICLRAAKTGIKLASPVSKVTEGLRSGRRGLAVRGKDAP